MRQNTNIKGITDAGQIDQKKIFLYTDDALAYISGPSSFIPALMESLKKYVNCQGTKLASQS